VLQDGKSGRTALHYAAESGHMALFTFLLSVPTVDLNCRTYSRLTPLMLARGRGHTEIIAKLRERGVQDDSPGSDDDDMVSGLLP